LKTLKNVNLKPKKIKKIKFFQKPFLNTKINKTTATSPKNSAPQHLARQVIKSCPRVSKKLKINFFWCFGLF